MFRRILIANRGEIAVRIIRACRELGVESVAVYSEADRAALHVREADHAVPVGPAPAAESYLNARRVIEAARRTGAEAIHPGYGFFSENAAFARAVERAGLVFIGPSPAAIERLGDKVKARELMAAAGVPIMPGSPGALETEEQAREAARQIGFPLMVKAVAGGGGKGLRLVESEQELAAAVRTVTGEARSSFGDGRFLVEKFLARPRHIEIQLFADRRGNLIHLFERECSIQRRHQKVAEESPSPFLTPDLRERMCEAALRAARAVNYAGAGTVEFLAGADRNFHFLEMNTRIQVEHPVTEMVTGIDLVRLQIETAAGAALGLRQSDVVQRGWALECRIYAEDPLAGFVPAPGVIETLKLPGGPGVRNDAGVYAGAEASVFYDPMISKLVAWGRDRAQALDRMRRALSEFQIAGELATNLDFHRWLMNHPRFIAGDFDAYFIDREYHPAKAGRAAPDPERLAAMLLAAALVRRRADYAATVSATVSARLSPWKALGRLDMLRR